MEDYTELFFPEEFTAHHKTSAVSKLRGQLSRNFDEDGIEVDMICGYGDLPIHLTVSEYTPKNIDDTRIDTLCQDYDGGPARFVSRYPPPIALKTAKLLQETCGSHLEEMLKHPQTLPSSENRRANALNSLVLKTVYRYHASKARPKRVIQSLCHAVNTC